MRAKIRLTFAAALAACGLFAATLAFAQSPALNPQDAEAAKRQQQQQLTQPLNNQPVWSEIRSGAPGLTQVRGRETNVLIQSAGQTWRALRNSQVSVWGGWAIVVVFLAILGFYAWRGAIPLHEPKTGRLIRRFKEWERVVHWTTATAFVILAITGLILGFGKSVLMPVIGHTLFSWLAQLAKPLHNLVGPLFIICTIIIFFTFLRNNFWKSYDWAWLKAAGGFLSKPEPASAKFNAGEKLWFWGGVLFLGLVVGVSGLVLDFPNFDQTRNTMQIANIIHLAGACFFIMGSLGHIYMGTIGMVGAYDAMKTGYVDETWAKEHHEYWYNDVKAGRVDAPVVATPAAGARPRPA
jgi:formate dehydrogenase subunit gamma